MSWPALIAWSVLAIVILLASRYVFVLLTLRRLRMTAPALAEHIEVAQVPSAHAALLALAAPRLEAFGFEFEYASRAPAPLVTRKLCLHYATTWWHRESGAWAVVTLTEQPEYGALYAVTFYTFYEPDPHLHTLARRAHELLTVHPDFDMQDSGGDLKHQWQTHLERMRMRAGNHLIRDKDHIAAIERRLPEETRAHLARSGVLEALADGSARLSWRGAWAYLRRYSDGVKRVQRRPLATADANGIDASDPRAIELRASADAIAMSNALATQRADAGATAKSLLLLVTGLLSLLVFGWRFDRLFSAVLVAVLLFHELGHLAAMRWAGYRDLQVFFIPLFGAMASGSEVNVTPWRKMVVLLAGPVPGIVLGCVLLHAIASRYLPPMVWLVSATSVLIVINVFNLLPLVPLDGGRFFDLLLMARLPRWRGVFAGLSAVGLFGVGVWLQAPLLAVLGGALMLGVPAQLRQARLLTALRGVHHGGQDSQGAWLLALARLQAEQGGAARYGQRLVIARSITASSLAAAPSFAAALAGLALYVLGLALPVWVFGQHGVDIFSAIGSGVRTGTVAPPRRNIDAELAAAPDAAARLALLLRAAGEAEDGEDYDQAHDYFQRALALTRDVPGSRPQQVEATLGVARNAEDVRAAKPMLEALLGSLNGSERDTRLQRAQVLMALAQDGTTSKGRVELSRLEEAVAIRGELLPAADVDLLGARQAVAWALWQAGRAADAEQQLRARLAALSPPVCDAACARDTAWLAVTAYVDLGWLLLSLDDRAAVAQLVRDHAAATAALASAGEAERLTVLNAWVRDANGDHAGAAQALAGLLDARAGKRMAINELQLLVDLACFAQRGGDAAAELKWQERLRARVEAMRKNNAGLSLAWLPSMRDSPYVWHRVRLDAEVAWLERHEPSLLETPRP